MYRVEFMVGSELVSFNVKRLATARAIAVQFNDWIQVYDNSERNRLYLLGQFDRRGNWFAQSYGVR